MTSKKKNPVWAFFASVKLAIFLLFCLATTSIIGTVIPQNQPIKNYIEHYGAKATKLMQVLDLTDMYSSWWFLMLLGLFSLNLIVCSLERIPNVIRQIRKDNLGISPERLEKMPVRSTTTLSSPLEESTEHIASFFSHKGWKTETRKGKDGVLLFSQKGSWTRLGVYVVHISILIVLFGALIGSPTIARKLLRNPHFAFKGSIMIPETRSTDHIFSFEDSEKIGLGFSVHLNYFNIEYYPNDMPKTYLSKVTVIDNGEPVLSTDIEVNTPLTYKGITFYQSSYQPYQDYVVSLKNLTTNAEKIEIAPPAEQIEWESGGITFGIINKEASRQVVQRVKVWFSDNQGEPSTFWVNVGQEAIIERPSGKYSFKAKQLYATGLQVAKDPGVWLVYFGCITMLIGLFIAFFMSHRKLWVYLRQDQGVTHILFTGSANKNKLGFEKKFTELINTLE